MIARRNKWPGVIALGSILFLCLTMRPASAGEVEDRIRALEEVQRANAAELEKLKGEQIELKREATEAAASLPTFSFRPGSGVSIVAADKSWELRFRSRFHYRLLTWPDDQALDQAGFSQFDLALRRVRQRINSYWEDRFYELDIEFDFGPDRGIQVQHGELHFHFDRLNPYLPDLAFGPRVSAFFNRHDTNWGSSSGGVFDRSMFQDGAGIGAGSQNNAIGLFWSGVPVGPGDLLFQAIYSNQGLTNLADQERPNSDKRAAHVAFNWEPFSKMKNKWLEGIDLGVGYQLDRIHPGEDGRSFFRVRTTERQRLRLIEVARDLDAESPRHYITPGFGWKVGPYWLRTALGWNRGDFDSFGGVGDVKGFMWRIANELFIWSPKGLLTGSTNTPGSVMIFTGFERSDYEADRNGLRACSSVVIGANCERAFAHNFNVGAWYFIRRALSVGLEYGRYHVNKIGRGAGDLKNVDSGDSVNFNTLEFGIHFDF